MAEDKKFTQDKETLESQLEKSKDLMKRDSEAIAECEAIMRDPQYALGEQAEWAKARKEGHLKGLERHQQMYEDTSDRLKKLSAKP